MKPRLLVPQRRVRAVTIGVGAAALAFTGLALGAPAAGAATPGPVSQLVITAPASATTGVPVNVTVTAEDAAGNTVTTFPDTVQVSSSDPAAALPTGATLTNGTGSFAVTLRTVGSETVTATDTANTTLTVTSPAIIVAAASSGTPVTDIAGVDRIATAVAVSQKQFPAAGSAGAVVLARSDTFADSVAGGPLAVAKNAPLLLTPTGALDPSVQSEIQRVLPSGGTVYLLGGTSALSPAVADGLTSVGFNVVRFAGVDRFDTAAQIASSGLGSPTTVMLATGNDFADALAGGPAAAANGAAILLTDGSVMPSATSSYLAAHPATVYALGGSATAADPSATPVVGTDRYQTAAMIATKWFTHPSSVGFVSGLDFPDALAGDAQMGLLGGPMLLVDPSTSTLPADVSTYLTTIAGDPTTAYAYGGSAVLPTALLTSAQTVIAPSTAPAVQLNVSGPTSTTAGAVFQVTVTATANGVAATSVADTVSLTSTDPAAVLPAPAALTNGFGSFNVTLSTTGTQTITAFDSTTGVVVGTVTVTVNP